MVLSTLSMLLTSSATLESPMLVTFHITFTVYFSSFISFAQITIVNSTDTYFFSGSLGHFGQNTLSNNMLPANSTHCITTMITYSSYSSPLVSRLHLELAYPYQQEGGNLGVSCPLLNLKRGTIWQLYHRLRIQLLHWN
jgi:hypothetical protein